jgi:hypothetical protein
VEWGEQQEEKAPEDGKVKLTDFLCSCEKKSQPGDNSFCGEKEQARVTSLMFSLKGKKRDLEKC